MQITSTNTLADACYRFTTSNAARLSIIQANCFMIMSNSHCISQIDNIHAVAFYAIVTLLVDLYNNWSISGTICHQTYDHQHLWKFGKCFYASLTGLHYAACVSTTFASRFEPEIYVQNSVTLDSTNQKLRTNCVCPWYLYSSEWPPSPLH